MCREHDCLLSSGTRFDSLQVYLDKMVQTGVTSLLMKPPQSLISLVRKIHPVPRWDAKLASIPSILSGANHRVTKSLSLDAIRDTTPVRGSGGL